MIHFLKDNSIHTIKKNKAFTLVETLVAISIFTMSVLVLMTVLSKGISDTGYAKKKIIAAYLAQEGIEYTRNVRDTYMLYSVSKAVGWTGFTNKMSAGSCQSATGCYFNPDVFYNGSIAPPMAITKVAFNACGASCTEMFYNSSTGKYDYNSYGGGQRSGYIRRIRAVSINANEMKIFSTVFWPQNSGTYSITLSESLYNWIE